ncbi:MAG: hypothetical protein KGN36_09125 [Acidobacteriota bacterium]|nr:hypothetical protein [Acidobacteriota bacterium]
MKNSSRVRAALFAIGALALLGGVVPARAGVVVTVGSATVSAGGSGSFDITLANTGASAQNIAGFGLAIATTDPDITFTGADFSTLLPYVFAGDSWDVANGFAFVTSAPGQTLSASDLSNSGTGNDIAAATSVGLARVLFSVSGGATAGAFPVTLTAYPATSLNDSTFANVPFTSVDGSITIQAGTAVPEPSAFLPLLLSVPFLLRGARRRR